MKTKVKLTFLINQEYTSIYVEDSMSGIKFLEMTLTPLQLSQILSRLGHVKVDAEINRLDLVGKKHECEKFVFEIPEEIYCSRNRDHAKIKEMADSLLSDGWISDSYFGSSDSFFKIENKYFARAIIRRYT